MHPPPQPLLTFLEPYDRSIQDLALAVRAAVLKELAPCCENIYDAYNAVAIGYGPTDRLRDGIIHIAVYAKHVNIGFNRGAELDDPDHILKGSGARIRHITIKTPGDLKRPAIRDYLRRARSLSNVAPPKGKSVTSTVKAIYPTRRRPAQQNRD